MNLAIGEQDPGIYDLIIHVKDKKSGEEINKKIGLTIK